MNIYKVPNLITSPKRRVCVYMHCCMYDISHKIFLFNFRLSVAWLRALLSKAFGERLFPTHTSVSNILPQMLCHFGSWVPPSALKTRVLKICLYHNQAFSPTISLHAHARYVCVCVCIHSHRVCVCARTGCVCDTCCIQCGLMLSACKCSPT